MAAMKAIAMAGLALNAGGSVPPLKANSGGMIHTRIQRFAAGGPVLGTGNLDTVPALLTPGEVVLSRRDVDEIKKTYRDVGNMRPMAAPDVKVPETHVVVNNYGNNEVKTSTGRGANGQQLIYITVRDAMRRGLANGDMDKVMAGRYRLSPQGGA